MQSTAGRRIEGNSRLAAPATRGARAAALRAGALLVAAAVAACGGGTAETDPLASIAATVREQDRAPAPLAEVWRRQPDVPLTLRPAVGNQNVYLALGNRLAAWAADDGIARWAPIELESEISAPPVALGQQVLVATRGDASSSPRLWWFANDSTPLAQTPMSAPVREISAVPGTVVYVDESGVGRLAGGVEWHTPVEGAATVELAADHGLALATTSDGRLLAFDVGSGALRWQHQTAGEVSRARVAGDRVFVGAGMEGIVALRINDGNVVWRRRLGTAVIGAPGLARDLLWAGALDSKLHAFKASNGTEMEGLLVDLSSRNYLDVVSFEPWVVAGATYGPWVAVRGPLRSERQQRPQTVTVRQPNVAGRADLALDAGTGPAGVAVVNSDGTVVFLQPRRDR